MRESLHSGRAGERATIAELQKTAKQTAYGQEKSPGQAACMRAKRGLWISILYTTRELVRDAESRAPPRTIESKICIFTGSLDDQHAF